MRFPPTAADEFDLAVLEITVPPLPHGLEDARHILDLDRLRWALWAVLLLALLLLLRRWLRRRAARLEPTTPPAAVEEPVVPQSPDNTVPEIVTRIGSLRDRHLAQGTFRQGCHELAALLRGFYEDLWREAVTTRTVGEIQRSVHDRSGTENGGAPGSLFRLLESLQFARADPSADDLESVCDLAADVATVAVNSGDSSPTRSAP